MFDVKRVWFLMILFGRLCVMCVLLFVGVMGNKKRLMRKMEMFRVCYCRCLFILFCSHRNALKLCVMCFALSIS